ncbi:hypothetical protein H8S90_08970 [Olivibacter sp. SDN3]|nr:helix-turn-helix domain-containing protein [Olivibacter sp. SDN3]QNL52459.1 hypothetical protein H8S90_08970 [Olivibacter sp. SDN3]
MDKHYGEIIEKVMRRNGYSISEAARLINVNRRSIYNWFEQPRLKEDTIFKIGCALRYDFSKEFPELFKSEDFQKAFERNSWGEKVNMAEEDEKISYWKDKYISLLEQYNAMLTSQGQNNNLSTFRYAR